MRHFSQIGQDWKPCSDRRRLCRAKLAALKQTGDPMSFRASEASARPQAVDSARQLVELIGKTANAWPTIKPWLNETDIKGLAEQVTLLCSPPATSGPTCQLSDHRD